MDHIPQIDSVAHSNLSLQSVNNSPLPVLGVINCDVTVAERTFPEHKFVVSSGIGPQVILGTNFLLSSKAVLNFMNNQFSLQFSESIANVEVDTVLLPETSRVCIAESIEVPPYHCCYVSCECSQAIRGPSIHVKEVDKF